MNISKLLVILMLLLFPASVFSQTGPSAPSAGIWAVIDTQYTVGTYTLGQTKARITLRNSTITKYTGVQFRVFYDKTAFTSATVSLVGSTSDLILQSVDSNSNGFVTITMVYTGSSSSYTIGDGERFEITLSHAAPSVFYSLSGIDSLKWVGGVSYPNLSSSQSGLDTVLNLHSWGGYFYRPHLQFRGKFVNITGTPSKNLTLSLEKKVKTLTTWSIHGTYVTDVDGRFSFNEIIDTTYYDVRLSIKGDTMNVGNLITTADASLINQWVLKTATPTGFDFYSADVNGSHNITITDAYGVFGRIAGRFSSWPNGVKDILFFTPSEYSTITANPNTNYTSSISGITNFYYPILPGQPDSVTYYVCVPGDANRTGYHMARMTPVTVTAEPPVGTPASSENVIDMRVMYDFPTDEIEVHIPSLIVDEMSMVTIPVTVKTDGGRISSLQLGLIYDKDLLEFQEMDNSQIGMSWLSFLNPMDGVIEWGGYDPTIDGKYPVSDGYRVFSLKFKALKPQGEWASSPLYTTRKFSGDLNQKDLSIRSTNGIMLVYRLKSGLKSYERYMMAYPNPTTGQVTFSFDVDEEGEVTLFVSDMMGRLVKTILNKRMVSGRYSYTDNINEFSSGVYTASLQTNNNKATAKIVKK